MKGTGTREESQLTNEGQQHHTTAVSETRLQEPGVFSWLPMCGVVGLRWGADVTRLFVCL